MEQNHLEALRIAFYLSRFEEAYSSLDFGNATETYSRIGEILDVKPNTIRQMRDEFDFFNSNSRKGRVRLKLSGSRLEIWNELDKLDQEIVKNIVVKILNKRKK